MPKVNDEEVDLEAIRRLRVRVKNVLVLLSHCRFQCPEDPAKATDLLNTVLSLGELTKWKEHLQAFLADNLTVECCISSYLTAVQNDLQTLRDASFRFILGNFESLYRTEEFLNMDKEHLCSILRDNKLNVKDEQVVFDAIVLWIKHNASARMVYAEELLYLVRLQTCDVRFLELVRSHYLVWDIPSFVERVNFTIGDLKLGAPGFRQLAEDLRRKPEI